jgi:hypothetical protein
MTTHFGRTMASFETRVTEIRPDARGGFSVRLKPHFLERDVAYSSTSPAGPGIFPGDAACKCPPFVSAGSWFLIPYCAPNFCTGSLYRRPLCSRLSLAQLNDYIFGSQFTPLDLLYHHSERKAQLRVRIH